MTIATGDQMTALGAVTAQLQRAVAAKKCWRCGCLQTFLTDLEATLPDSERPADLAAAVQVAHERLEPAEYDCLGCALCYPALATNALSQGGYQMASTDACLTTPSEERQGWPPLPGSYTPLRYRASIAVCTLTDAVLAASLLRDAVPELAIVGTLQTENLGIERLITNVLANPNIRFLVVCGRDSQQKIGHLPGQSLVALAQRGIDDRSRIIGAHGKRPVLRNLPPAAVEHFRQSVEIIDRIGVTEPATLQPVLKAYAARDVEPAEPYAAESLLQPLRGYEPSKLVQDPAGYLVVYVDRARGALSLEHYQNNGVLDAIIEGRTAAELYTPAIDRGLLSRLDHAAYLGRELARAERSLVTGQPFVQDAAPERQAPAAACQCGDAACADVPAAPILLSDLPLR